MHNAVLHIWDPSWTSCFMQIEFYLLWFNIEEKCHASYGSELMPYLEKISSQCLALCGAVEKLSVWAEQTGSSYCKHTHVGITLLQAHGFHLLLRYGCLGNPTVMARLCLRDGGFCKGHLRKDVILESPVFSFKAAWCNGRTQGCVRGPERGQLTYKVDLFALWVIRKTFQVQFCLDGAQLA